MGQPTNYEGFGLTTMHKNIGFLTDPRFLAAYDRGMNSGHRFADYIKSQGAPGWDVHWQFYVACWAADHARHLPGDFVECGVNTGNYSLAVCEYIAFNTTGKHFWLFDTFKGPPETHMTEAERKATEAQNAGLYFDCWDVARQNFAPYPNAHLVRGTVPETFADVDIEQVCYLSLDLSYPAPERAAIEHFWPKLVPGAVVVLDDYGWIGYEAQQRSMDAFAATVGTSVLLLPTGQGLMFKR